jgi:hypothetical protein
MPPEERFSQLWRQSGKHGKEGRPPILKKICVGRQNYAQKNY